MKDLYNSLKTSQLTNPATATNTVTSAKVDMQGFGSLLIAFAIGLSGDTLSGTVYWTLSLTESDDDSTYTAVAAADTHNGVAAIVVDDPAEDETVYRFGYRGKKRYVKGVATKTGTHTNGTPIGILAVQGLAGNQPVI